MTSRARTLLLTTLALAWLALSVAGCAMEGDGRPRGAASPSSWVEGAARANQTADEAIARGDLAAARQSLAEALASEIPRGVSPDDARVVRMDLLFRLSEVELRAGNAARAADRADEGLNLGARDDVFTANLLVARGKAREALGREREAAGDYFDALEINEKLLEGALGQEDGEDERERE
jgi:tetratricopeptide (TPR) repeat protein